MNPELLMFPSSLVGGRPRPRRPFTDPFSSPIHLSSFLCTGSPIPAKLRQKNPQRFRHHWRVQRPQISGNPKESVPKNLTSVSCFRDSPRYKVREESTPSEANPRTPSFSNGGNHHRQTRHQDSGAFVERIPRSKGGEVDIYAVIILFVAGGRERRGGGHGACGDREAEEEAGLRRLETCVTSNNSQLKKAWPDQEGALLYCLFQPKRMYIPSSTRSNKETQLLFSQDLASLERSIRKEVRSSSTDNTTCVSLDSAQPPSTQTLVPSTDTRSPLSTDNTHLPSTNILHPTSIDTPSQTSIDTELRDMVAPLILVRDNNGNLHDQEGHLRNAAVVKEEKVQEGDFEVESLMSFGGSQWCRSTPDLEHRSTYTSPNRSIGTPEHRSTMPTESTASCNDVKILTHEEFAAKHPHPPSPFNA
ncbi:hypothetical protein F2Q70_00025872 [Brassica cretica]|uniref:Uncharacterized protein n=1 Tax=Brassica cretica TaxID=69181 RepID=A0A8S9L9I3_BRACR|nr:hypothetical protein F2Q70_00025872 [Brassica cretica]